MKILTSGFLCLFLLTACLPEKDSTPEPKKQVEVQKEQLGTQETNTQQDDERILDIQEVTSAQGVKAWLVEDHNLPIIALHFSFRHVGAAQDNKDKQGLARLLSNTMDEGAGDLPSQEFQKTLSDNSISLFFSSGRDNFGGTLKTLSRNKDTAFNLLKLALTEPRFDAEPVERMKQANISRIQSSKGNPDWINARLFNDVAFTDHPYALNSGGTLSTLKNITTDDLKQRHKTSIRKDNLVIGVAGDITPNELKTLLDNIFGDLPNAPLDNSTKELTLQNQGKTYLYKKDIPQTIITASLPSIKETDPDYYALRLLNFIYGGGGFGSRLMEEAREKRGLTYGIYSSLQNQDYINLLTVSTSTKSKSVQEMMGIIKHEMDTIKNTTVSEETLQNAKSYMTGSMPLGLTSTDKIASVLLSLQLNERSLNYLDELKNNINKVTTDDLTRVAKRVLDPSKLLTVMVGQPKNIENAIELKELPNVE